MYICRSKNIRCRNEWSALRNRNNIIMTSGYRIILGNFPDDPLPPLSPPPYPSPPHCYEVRNVCVLSLHLTVLLIFR